MFRFETTGTLTVEADGRIRLHTEYLKAARLPVKGLLDLLGIDIARMIRYKKDSRYLRWTKMT